MPEANASGKFATSPISRVIRQATRAVPAAIADWLISLGAATPKIAALTTKI